MNKCVGDLYFRRNGADVLLVWEGVEGFVVYSVGETGNFDGGKPDVKPEAKEILFRYPLPKYMQPR